MIYELEFTFEVYINALSEMNYFNFEKFMYTRKTAFNHNVDQ